MTDLGVAVPLMWAEGPSSLDWSSFSVGLLGVFLSVAGFWIAIWQIQKTKTAAQAATLAATVGTERIRYNQLLMVVPQLQDLEIEIYGAIEKEDSFAVERALLRWRQLVGTGHGILSQMGSSYAEAVEAIEKTRGSAITAKGKLAERVETKTVASIAAGVRKEISAVNDKLGSIVGKLATELPEEVGNP